MNPSATPSYQNPEACQEALSILHRSLQIPAGRALDALDTEIKSLIKLDYRIAFFYNEFRIANISKLPKTRPQILLGGPNGIIYPNFHHNPFFEVADVICLTCAIQPSSFFSALHCHPATTFQDILNRLPRSFQPDFFWDNQIERKHFIPAGIHLAPFPIAASVCHNFLHKSVEHICELFDCIITMSEYHAHILRKKYPNKIVYLPFGVNWGSFDYMIKPSWEKQIDVCITFEPTDSAIYAGKRDRVIELTKQFKEKYGDRFSIDFYYNHPFDEYVKKMQSSRITINVVGVHGPYNYRTVEAMNAGSMVFQYDWDDDPFFSNKFSGLFIDGVHGASFNFENFEKKLLFYLENPHLIEKIAKEACSFVQEKYSYKLLFQQMIDTIKGLNVTIPRTAISDIGYHDADMIHYYQGSKEYKLMAYGVYSELKEIDWIKYNNLMILSGTFEPTHVGYLLLNAEQHLTEEEKFNSWAQCLKYYDSAMASVPVELSWLVQWNFFLLSLERGLASKADIESMIAKLEKANPIPFDERRIIFKYYVNSSEYFEYHSLNSPEANEYIEFNLDLLRHIDSSQDRAALYRSYALKASKYFLDAFIKNEAASIHKTTQKSIGIFAYVSPGVSSWDFEQINKGISGSEEAIIYLSQKLAQLGYQVYIIQILGKPPANSPHAQSWSNPRIIPLECFDVPLLDFAIVWKRVGIFELLKKRARKIYLWPHDFGLRKHFDCVVDDVIWLSEWQRQDWAIDNPELLKFTKIIGNGINPDQFQPIHQRNNPYSCIYGSHYYRGLEILLDIWPEIKKQFDQATLDIYYGWQLGDISSEKEIKMRRQIKEFARLGVLEHGQVGHIELNKAYSKSSFWTYPCTFPETFCISALRAQFAGAIPVVIEKAALQETVRYGYKCAEPSQYYDTLIKAMSEAENITLEDRIKMRDFILKDFTWDAIAAKIKNLLLSTS